MNKVQECLLNDHLVLSITAFLHPMQLARAAIKRIEGPQALEFYD